MATVTLTKGGNTAIVGKDREARFREKGWTDADSPAPEPTEETTQPEPTEETTQPEPTGEGTPTDEGATQPDLTGATGSAPAEEAAAPTGRGRGRRRGN